VVTAVRQNPGLITWRKQLRVHQYVKNSLVRLPVITSRQFTYMAISFALIACAAFSLCASAVYIVNDLLDIEADRQHPKKKHRPLASGVIKPLHRKIASRCYLHWPSPARRWCRANSLSCCWRS
jgi:4-hydroxybenzoate polyprenyltransferase